MDRKRLWEKAGWAFREIRALQIPLYAANACFFLVLAVFPGLALLLSLLRHTSLEVAWLEELLRGFLPGAFGQAAHDLIRRIHSNLSPTAMGISAVTALWSAGRGIYGILKGLNAVYGAAENRGWLAARLISAGYTLAFLAALILTLALHVFGTGLLKLLTGSSMWEVPQLRYPLLLILQTGIFTAMFTVLPDRKNRILGSLPGAVLASAGWLLFSGLFSVYAERILRSSRGYGGLYAAALGMLWLYFCLCIFFWGGAVNAMLEKRR